MTGKFRRDNEVPKDARRYDFDFPPIDKEEALDAVEVMGEIAESKSATIPQVAIAWLLQKPAVTSVIVGAKKMEQLEDNLRSVDLELSTKEQDRISDITQPDTLYPEWMYQFQNRERDGE